MTEPNVTHETYMKPKRARPVRGGKSTCARCNEPRDGVSAYCVTHRREYHAQYGRNTRAELKRLRAIVAGTETA